MGRWMAGWIRLGIVPFGNPPRPRAAVAGGHRSSAFRDGLRRDLVLCALEASPDNVSTTSGTALRALDSRRGLGNMVLRGAAPDWHQLVVTAALDANHDALVDRWPSTMA
jgi:hypothetical protein